MLWTGLMVLFLSLSVTWMGCDKDNNDDDDDNNTTAANSLSARISGANLAVPIEFEAANVTGSYTAGKLTLTATGINNKKIVIGITGSAPGTFPIANPSTTVNPPNTLTYTEVNGKPDFVAYTGNIVITEWDTANKRISGTFQADAQVLLSGVARDIDLGVIDDVSY